MSQVQVLSSRDNRLALLQVFFFGRNMRQVVKDIISWLPPLLDGAKITVLLTLSSVTVGLFLSVFLALGKIAKSRILNAVCSFYVFFLRGTPLLMQLYFIYYGLPKINPSFVILRLLLRSALIQGHIFVKLSGQPLFLLIKDRLNLLVRSDFPFIRLCAML